MHEVSIAMGMAEELTRIAKENNARKILKIRLNIGKLSGIVVDSLEFAFNTIKREYPLLADADLIINEIPGVLECGDCGRRFETEYLPFGACTGCNSMNLRIRSGNEQHIENIELEV